MKTWLLILAAISTTAAFQTPPPRDPGPARAPGAGVVRGRITSAATGQPLHRVRITLNGPATNAPTAVTDTEGAFEVVGVPPGSYTVTAARAGYLRRQYGQARPREAGRSIVVRDEGVADRIDMALQRGGVAFGGIADELGDPCPAVRVEAVEFRYIGGRRVAVAAAVTATNDLGQFRLSGLEPGTYLLRASASETWPSDDGTDSHTYAITYYPGVTASDKAEHLSVAVGQTLSNLDFRLQVGRTAAITGVLQNADGEPIASQVVNLDRLTRSVGGAPFSMGFGGVTRTDQNGAFEIRELAPGEYLLYSGTDTARARQALTLTDGEVRHVVLSPKKPTAVAGSIVSDEGTPPAFVPAQVRVTPIGSGPDSLLPSFSAPRPAVVRSDWTFRIASLDGPYLLRAVGLPDDWMLAAVRLGTRDITDVPLDVPAGGGDISGVKIVLAREGARIEGRVVDRDGAAAPDTTVLVFAADPARWTVASRFVKAVRPDETGRFSVGGLPASAYFAVAMDLVAEGQWEDGEFLRSLMPTSPRVDLTKGGTATVTLTLEPTR